MLSEHALLEEIRQDVPEKEQGAGWTIAASRPLADKVADHAFGSRTAFAAPEENLGRSRTIAAQMAGFTAQVREFAACPRISWPLCGANWLACGAAALSFDPVCGDGAAYAVREAILASAVLIAAAEGGGAEDPMPHYVSRLSGGFGRHLALCGQLYREGGSVPWWQQQVSNVEQGLE